MLFDTVSAPKKGGKRDENVENVGKSYTVEEILHPTLHRKLPDFIGIFHIGCRKCRIFLQTFFWKEICAARQQALFPVWHGQDPRVSCARVRYIYCMGPDIQRSYGCAKGLLSSVPYEFFYRTYLSSESTWGGKVCWGCCFCLSSSVSRHPKWLKSPVFLCFAICTPQNLL